MSINGLYQKDKLYSTNIFIFLVIYLLDKNNDHSYMLTSDIRRENARTLAASKEVGSPAEFGRRTGMSDSQISQLIGENPTKNIGNIIARRIEDAFSKPHGWIDVLHSENQSKEITRHVEDRIRGDVATVDEILELITLYKDAPPDDREMIMETARLHLKRRKALAAVDR